MSHLDGRSISICLLERVSMDDPKDVDVESLRPKIGAGDWRQPEQMKKSEKDNLNKK